MIAIVVMVVVFILALGLLTLGGNIRLSGKRQMKRSGAEAMARSGIEYGYWQVRYKGASLPQTYSLNSSSNGYTLKFTVTVTDNSANVAGTMKLVSAGTQNGETRTVTEVMATPFVKTVFDYALCSNSNLGGSPPIQTGASGANGDTRANGYIYLGNPKAKINGNAMATGSISVTSITGTQTPSAPTIAFPALDTALGGIYDTTATVHYTGDQTWSGFTFGLTNLDGTYALVYVNGNVTLNAGTYSGSGTIVATGTITINGNVSPALSGDKMAFLTATRFNVTSTCTVNAFCYAHNGSNTAPAQSSGTNTVLTVGNGALVADSFALINGGIFSHDPAMNATLGKKLHLPGY